MQNLAERRTAAVTSAAGRRLLDDEQPLCGIIDLDAVTEQVGHLHEAFAGATSALHTVAVKAGPLTALLKLLVDAGMGCEVASKGELALAVEAGCPPERIVFDSPAKTHAEIAAVLAQGVSMNIDNFGELARVDAALGGASPRGRIGLRINPQSGAGAIDALSTATRTSKFGVGIGDPSMRDAVLDAYITRPWLTQIHVHSGSQGVALSQAAHGVAAAVAVANEVNATVGRRQVKRIDVGGGLPVNFHSDEVTPTYREYRQILEAAAPELFDGTYELVTEFGRSLLAKSGTLLSRVEYVKDAGGSRIAITHAGVQVAVRTVFNPGDWPLRILTHDPDGRPKTTPVVPQDIAGPACFAGDVLALGRPLEQLEPGDIIAVPDTGAYYFSNHFSYNALPRPAVYGYRISGRGACTWFTLRDAQRVEEIVYDAGHPAPVPMSEHPEQGGA